MTFMISETKDTTVNNDNVGDLMEIEKKRGNRKMQWLISLQILTIFFIFLLVGTFFLFNRPIIKENQYFTNITQNITQVKEDIVTLYALDPIAHSFCFDDGKYGRIFLNRSVYNRCNDIDFNNYNDGSFTVGKEGGKFGIIIDLGSAADLQNKYKYRETMGNGHGFASIHRQNKTILILEGAPYKQMFQPMEESDELFQQEKPIANAIINLGHIYILRITYLDEPAFERIAKLIVIAYKPNEWVTIRWDVIT